MGAVLAATLTGCGLPSAPAADEAPTSSETESTSAPTAGEAEREFYDNLVVYRQMAHQSDAVPSSWKTPPEGTWSEVDASTRDLYVSVGKEMCASGFSDTGLAEGNTDVYMSWLSARFLCPEHLDVAESELVAFTSQQLLDVLEYSVLKGNATTEDVMLGLVSCEAAMELAYEPPPGYDKGYFCWIMRVSAIGESGDEWDFLKFFDGENADEAGFDALAKELGATPSALGGLLGDE